MLHSVQRRGGAAPSSFHQRAATVAAVLALAALIGTPAMPLGAPVLAQTPAPTAVVEPADPRTDTDPPAVTGAPLAAALAVIAIGVLAALGTFLYVRLVARR